MERSALKNSAKDGEIHPGGGEGPPAPTNALSKPTQGSRPEGISRGTHSEDGASGAAGGLLGIYRIHLPQVCPIVCPT